METPETKTILGLIGSPRKSGNCELLVKAISRHIAIPHQLQLLRLHDFDLRPCKGCYRCLMGEMRCPQPDDFYKVLEAVTGADALIVTAPAYFLGPNAILKRFLDRGLTFYAHADQLWGKPSLGIGVAGLPGKEGYTLLGLENFLKLLMTDVKCITMLYGALPGEVLLDEANRRAAGELAAALFSPPPAPADPSCPVCGGTTFRFKGRNRIRCMLCSNDGTMAMANGQFAVTMKKSDHELFCKNKEDIFKHFEWLVSMKARFAAQRENLKQIRREHRQPGEWIKP